MKKNIDFSKGIRGKHASMDLKIVGPVESVWAVCISKSSPDLVPFKIYKIDICLALNEIKLKNEKGEVAFYPREWFAPVEVSKKTLGLLEKAV